MQVIKVAPRGYCHGVVDALNLVAKTIADESTKKPIYILGEIVHNKNVTDALTERGVITLNGASREELLLSVDSGTVIITAHGISPMLIQKAKNMGLFVVDATCKDVYKTHDVIRDRLNKSYEVIYIGKKGHPETEGCVSISDDIHFISSVLDIDNLVIDKSKKICVTNQTTLSMWDMKNIVDVLIEKYENIEIINEICNATQLRQQAVASLSSDIDLLIVVGDPKSNNTNKLVEISKNIAGVDAIRVNNLSDLDISLLKNINKVAVTAGASSPTLITRNVVEFLEQFDPNDPSTHDTSNTIDMSRIIPRIRK